MRQPRRPGSALVLVLLALAAPAAAQAPRVAPQPGFLYHHQHSVDLFVVQRWLSKDDPEISPAGFCACITVVYEGVRKVLDLGADAGVTGVAAVNDITGDRQAELMVTNYSGGSHCCESTAIYSIEGDKPRALLSVATGSCQGELVDLDKNGVPEFQTCDDSLGYEFCSFAFSPMPTVVFAFDRSKGVFAPATPAFARYLPAPSIAGARQVMADNAGNEEIARCAALGPALELAYRGRQAEGLALFRQLYTGVDAAAIAQKAIDKVTASAMWLP
jgi:hypothetical protein